MPGRNTARACLGQRLPMYPPFPVSWQKGVRPCITFPQAPPLIPDGRISRVRLAATAFPQKPFPPNPKLKHSPAFTPGVSDLISSSTFFVVTLLTDTSSAVVHEMPAIYREPLCLLEVLPPKGRCPSIPSTSVTRSSSLIRTHAPDQNPPADFGVTLYGRSLQVIASPCWKLALPDVISVDLSLDAWIHTPAPSKVPVPITSLGTSAFPE